MDKAARGSTNGRNELPLRLSHVAFAGAGPGTASRRTAGFVSSSRAPSSGGELADGLACLPGYLCSRMSRRPVAV